MIWVNHNSECIKIDTHMVCSGMTDDGVKYMTYNMIKICSEKKSPNFTGKVYDTLSEAKAVCHVEAGRRSGSKKSKKGSAKYNIASMKAVLGSKK